MADAADTDPDPASLCADFLSFSARDTASSWLVAPDLAIPLHAHLSRFVPHLLRAGQGAGLREQQREELGVQLLLLAPLEWLLLGEEPSAAFAALKEANRVSALCGHVFRVGEPTYSCRECAADPTCVLCMSCFLKSEHKEHRYRMTTSGGGGFCDCGDSEAWKQGAACSEHKQDQDQDQDQDPVQSLDPDLVFRAFGVFRAILRYAVDMLTWDREDSVPAGLEPPEKSDSFYCMLFNDEVHTYEQVIYTLQKAVNCDQKEAVSFATAVDREGRTSVRFGDFQFCEQAKSVIVRNTGRQSKPLKVLVMHSSVVAHQVFALKSLTWLSQVISHSDGLRRVLCTVALESRSGSGETLVDQLMLNDSKMWKGARSIYHQLLMNSLLMDPQYKKVFAVHFAKNYERLQSDYVKDDHDREFSITDLSVQIFTVPSLARMLMVDQDLMAVIIRTFLNLLRHRDLQGRFQFDRYTAQQAFKFGRVQSLIGDLKYVLMTRPTVWSDELRLKFMDGFSCFLELLRCMQGMDAVVRQVGQHIEMEPEWEAAFTLQMKLTPITSMIQDWIRTDEQVVMETYRCCLIALTHSLSGLADGEQPISLSLAGHMVETFRYQVSQEKVSIHLPLCRLLAGLHVLLSRTEVASRFPEQLPLGELSPPLLIELPLRCLVLCAQVHAGMWRRNGFSLINQIYYYHNVKCRVEMFDKDLIMLQVGASMMNPNHFLMIVLSRFELFHIFSTDSRKRFRDSNKDVLQQNNTLIEEMLHLIIMITGERFTPGVGQVEPEDELRREVMHQLCVRPMAHSELVKALNDNGNKETGLERVIDSVASFRKPGVSGRGLYELKPEWSKHFNLYFHHYSRADQSKAEEAQRKIRTQASGPGTSGGSGGSGTNGSTGWTESMLQRVLHLIAMALIEEKQQLESNGEEELTFNYSLKIQRPGSCGSLLSLLETLHHSPHLELHKDMIGWILTMVSHIRTLRLRSEEESVCVTAAVTTDHTLREREAAERRRKAEMARLRREKVMAQISAMQKHFIRENRELFCESRESAPCGEEQKCSSEDSVGAPVCVGPARAGLVSASPVTCILCQEEQEVRSHNRVMVLAAFVQRSTVLSQNRQSSSGLSQSRDVLFMNPALSLGIHTASCGHTMHATCWQRYFEAVHQKEQRRQQRLRGNTSFNVEKGEFLCPLCECLSNSVIPLLPPASTPATSVEQNLDTWVSATTLQLQLLRHKWSSGQGAEHAVTLGAEPAVTQGTETAETRGAETAETRGAETPVPEGFNQDFVPEPLPSPLSQMMSLFSLAVYKVALKTNPNETDPRLCPVSWSTCAFTIQATERLLWDDDKPLFGSLPCRQEECLSALCRFTSHCWTVAPPTTAQQHFSRLFSVFSASHDAPCLLDLDMFHLLVYCALSHCTVQALDQTGRSSSDSAHLNLLHLVTVAHLVQVLLTLTEKEDGTMEQDGAGAEEHLLLELYTVLQSHMGSALPAVASGWHLWRRVKAALLPFLRCCAMFFHYMNSTTPPAALLLSDGDQWAALCSYLSIPSNILLLYSHHHHHLDSLIHSWCSDPRVLQRLSESRSGPGSVLVQFPRESNSLVDLPEDYSDLINRASTFTCPRLSMDQARAPTLCLVCGTLLCSQSYCCQTVVDGDDLGACTYHALTCGEGAGLFFRVRECQVLFVAGKTRGCFYPPPYLDDYGETDQGLKRGNPLRLCSGRYLKIQRLWRQHALAEVIAHAQEANQTLAAIDWQHL
uniref:E3 ubiquitin-protein ligase n=1 Tax=Knipowitschia caucasica TaxID=637954 RepID=A0AAV2L6C4_KNICA